MTHEAAQLGLLADIAARGAEIRDRLRQLLPSHATGDTKTNWLIGSMDIALEHHEAVEQLVKNKLNGSAFGVVRILFDTFLRAVWISESATGEQIEQAASDALVWPKMWKMRETIKEAALIGCDAEVAARRDSWFEFLKESWPIMCDYTHSGSRQIARRFIESGEVKPDYSDGEIAESVNLTNLAVLMMTAMLFARIGPIEKAEEILTMLADYGNEFGERLQAVGQGGQ
jgi:hypothetical protein